MKGQEKTQSMLHFYTEVSQMGSFTLKLKPREKLK